MYRLMYEIKKYISFGTLLVRELVCPYLELIGVGLLYPSPLMVRQYNDQLMLLERAFTDPAGLPLRPSLKYVHIAELK